MSDHQNLGLSEASYLVPVFESLRRFDGLTAKHLSAVRTAQPLLRLPIVQNQAVQSGHDLADAAIEVIVEQIQELVVTDRIIADAILHLGILIETYKSHNVPKRAVYQLEAGGLGDRRTALVNHWAVLHQALGAAPTSAPPGEHTLRSRTEALVFERLASLLLNPKPVVAVSEPGEQITTAQSVDSEAKGNVIVVGGAAIDHIWRVRSIPEVGTSNRAMTYNRGPGGKGVSQAVAAAHLDLEVRLLAALADNRDGREIEAYLKREGVGISMLKMVEKPAGTDDDGLRMPATGIFELPAGNSSAAVWRDDVVELDIATINRHAAALIACDVLLLTFELPQPVLKHTLSLVSAAPNRPVVIVTPGQPYADGHLLSPVLKQVDYLVAHLWELEGFTFDDEAKYDPQLLSESLFSLGLRSLCLLGDLGGTIYERGKPREMIPVPYSLFKNASITRDAFCAALAARLIEDRSLTGDKIRWAAAAMASFADGYHQGAPHPRRETVDEKYRQFTGTADKG